MKVLIATRDPAVYHALSGHEQIEIVEALSTDRAYRYLGDVDLAVIDLPDLVANGRVSQDLLGAAGQEYRVVDSRQFLEAPASFLQEVHEGGGRPTWGAVEPQVVALTSHAGSGGGVGKTTLALSLARQFHAQMGLPTLVMECCYGYSGLSSLLPAAERPFPIRSLHDLLSGAEVTRWEEEGIDLVAMNFELDRPHFDRENRQRLAETTDAIRKLVRGYALTVLDTCWPHQITFHLRDLVGKWLIVADAGRRDSLHSALQLRRYLQERELAAWLVVNKRRRENLQNIPHDLALPYSKDTSPTNLGGQLLGLLYPQETSPYKQGVFERLLGGGR